MNIAQAFAVAAQTVADPINFGIIVLGVLLGMFMGMMPGLGGTVALALLIPFTFGMDPMVAFMLMTAAVGGTNFGGSISAILINTPGGGPNAATLIDGYPMARAGRGGEAIGASATASAMGAFFGIAVFIASIPVLMTVLFLFRPPDVFWLGIWGMTVVAIIVQGRVISGLISAALGVMISLHGINKFTANVRWDYGFVFMQDGFPLVHALMGLFAVSEMMRLVAEGGTISDEDDVTTGQKLGEQLRGVKAVFDNKWLFVRSAVIGAIIGMIPGAGGTVANYIAYFQAIASSPDSDKFGSGDIRGVIAPEASNDAKDGTMFLPTLGFGVPGSGSMAVLLGAFVLHGILPGSFLFENHLPIVAVIMLSLLISNVLTSLIGLVTANYLVKVTKINTQVLAPIVLLIAFFGAYVINFNIYQVFLVTLIGVLAFIMIKVEMSRIPMALGLVLGPIVEENFFRSLQIARGEYGIFMESWISRFLIGLAVLTVFAPWVKPTVNRILDRLTSVSR